MNKCLLLSGDFNNTWKAILYLICYDLAFAAFNAQ